LSENQLLSRQPGKTPEMPNLFDSMKFNQLKQVTGLCQYHFYFRINSEIDWCSLARSLGHRDLNSFANTLEPSTP